MNTKSIRFILGWILNIEALLMLLPVATAVVYREEEGIAYALVMAVCAAVGALMTYKKPNNPSFYAKEGFVCTALGWILMSAFGCVPFMLTGEIPSFIDAMFEMVSGFTTTGASVVLNVEELSHCTNMWRCFSHWIGGMGILVFLLAVLPLVGGSNMQLMKAESPGPSVGKLVPKVRFTARILYVLYVALTVLQVLVMLLGGMTLYEALCTSFGTAGTGGGFKVSRIVIGFKSVLAYLGAFLHPRAVRKVKFEDKDVDGETMRAISVYFTAAIGLFTISVLLVALDGFDLVTTFSAVAATFNNIGPGLGVAGPTSNFAAFSDFSKVVMTMDMLLGRLEVFPMLMLFYPPLWKESIGEARIRRNRSPFH